MIATRGFVRTLHFFRARLSHFPSDAEALRVWRPRIQLVLICVLVCRGYRIPCLDCSSFDLRILLRSYGCQNKYSPGRLYSVAPLGSLRSQYLSFSCPYPNTRFASTVSSGFMLHGLARVP